MIAGLLLLAVASGSARLALVDHQKQRAAQSGIEITRALSIAVDSELQSKPVMPDRLAEFSPAPANRASITPAAARRRETPSDRRTP